MCTYAALPIERRGERQVADGAGGARVSHPTHCVPPAPSLHLALPALGTPAASRGLQPRAALPGRILRPRAPAPHLLTGSAPAPSHAEKPIGRGERGSNNKSGFSGAQGYRNAKLLCSPGSSRGAGAARTSRPAAASAPPAAGDPRRRAGPLVPGPNKEAAPAARPAGGCPGAAKFPWGRRRGDLPPGPVRSGAAQPRAPPTLRAHRYP